MAKIARKFMAHYINAAIPEDGEEMFELLGEDLEEFNAEMSAKVDKKQNILGETDVIISGYEKTAEVATYYANPRTMLIDQLQSIINEGKVLEAVSSQVVDVYLWQKPTGQGYPAAMEKVYIEIKSYGGDTTGVQIPFTIHYTGKRQKGYFDVENRSFYPAPEDEV